MVTVCELAWQKTWVWWSVASCSRCNQHITVQYVSTYRTVMCWSHQELNPNCVYTDTETKENPFTFLLNIVFISQSEIPSSFLNCKHFCVFADPSCTFVNEMTFLWCADWVWDCLALTLLLSWGEGQVYGLTKIESYNRMNGVFSG